MKKTIALLSLLACLGSVNAKEYLTWPKLFFNNTTLYVDVDSVGKVGSSIVFDAILVIEINGQSYRGANRVLMPCDGKHWRRIATPLGWEFQKAFNGELRKTLNAYSSLETTERIEDIPSSQRTPAFRTSLQNLCKTAIKPNRDFLMVVAVYPSNNLELLRLSTITVPAKGQVEVWVDEVQGEKVQSKLYDGDRWLPEFDKEGNSVTFGVASSNRVAVSKRRFDCENGRIAQLTKLTYNKDGSVGDSIQNDPTKIASLWMDAIPNTIGESLLLTVCAI